MSDYGRERIVLVEIDQPLCTRLYGDGLGSPTPASGCMAVLGVDGEHKCFNTRASCQDAANYDAGTLTLRFARRQHELARYYGHVIPSLLSHDIAPATLNLAAMYGSSNPLGQREVVTLSFEDHLHSDLLVDKYRLERQTGDASLIHSGTAAGGSPANDNTESLELAADAPSSIPAGAELRLVSGVGSVQERPISSYDGATKVATVAEGWRVNLVTRSEQVDQWSDGGAAVTADAYADPDGEMTIDTLTDDSVTLFENRGRSISVPDDSATYVLSMLVRKDLSATQRAGINCGLSGGSAVNQNIRFALDGTNVSGAGSPTMVSYDANHWLLSWTIGNNSSGNTTLAWTTYPATSATKSGSDQAPAVGSMSIGRMHARRSTDSDDYIKTEAAAITLPDSSTDYEVREAYDPNTRGTFWGKWLARNPYYSGYPLRVYEGFLGDDVEDMRVRHYIIDRVEGPADGQVRVIAKDTFTKLEAKKAMAPPASRGELGSTISAVSSSATLSPSGIGDEDYPHRDGSPSEMYLAIGDELIKSSRSDDTLSLTQRGALGTTADEHEDEDLVQWVLVYFAQRAIDIVYDLLVNYGGIPAESIDFDDWEEQAEDLEQLYTAVIATPTPVAKLVGELCQQAGFTVWHDTATGMVNLRALRATASTATITDDGWIVDGTLRTKRQDDKRVSQVWVYYGQRNALEKQDDPKNYFSRVVVIDPDAEAEDQYGTPQAEQIFSRWIPQFGRSSAVEAGERILSIFRDPPIEARFSLDASKDEEVALARFVTLETADIQDETGAVETGTQYAVVSLERSEFQVHVVVQEVSFAAVPGTGSESDPRTIFIENDADNLNLRTIHDSLYGTPPEGSPGIAVTFIVLDGVVVGSSSVSNYAMRTGIWTSSVDLAITNRGRIQGVSGRGGAAGSAFGASDSGSPGGNALLVESAISIDNTDGEIWGGGGGGGAGGSAFKNLPGGENASSAGGGGGAGQGDDSQPGGSGVWASGATYPGYGVNGGTGTSDAAGSGGSGADSGAGYQGGTGGDGGAPGQPGNAGIAVQGVGWDNAGSPGSGGAAGDAVNGSSLVTWTGLGDVRGDVS